eukprot:326760-Amphidinium_carterae.1
MWSRGVPCQPLPCLANSMSLRSFAVKKKSARTKGPRIPGVLGVALKKVDMTSHASKGSAFRQYC